MEDPLRHEDSPRHAFVSWQCRLRKRALRDQGGRPSPGMRPRVMLRNGNEISPAITVLLVELEPDATADVLCHIGRKSQDPQGRYEEGLKLLSSSYYLHPEDFCGDLTALFSPDSSLAKTLLMEGFCILHFEEGAWAARIPCQVEQLDKDAPAYKMTYWHNFLFNPTLPSHVCILAFHPDWTQA
jgi:hypothetical protein